MAREPGQEVLPDHYFRAVLKLSGIGVKGRILRRLGKLERLVILVPGSNHYSVDDEQRENSVEVNKTKKYWDNMIGGIASRLWSRATVV